MNERELNAMYSRVGRSNVLGVPTGRPRGSAPPRSRSAHPSQDLYVTLVNVGDAASSSQASVASTATTARATAIEDSVTDRLPASAIALSRKPPRRRDTSRPTPSRAARCACLRPCRGQDAIVPSPDSRPIDDAVLDAAGRR